MTLKSLLTALGVLVTAGTVSASAQTYVYDVGQEVTVNHKIYKVVGENVVANYDFASGNYDGWVSTDAGSAVDGAYWEVLSGGPNGVNYLHNTGKENGGSDSKNNIRCAWDLQAGKTYLASYYTKGSNANVRFWNSDLEGVKTPANGLALLEGSASDDWMQNIVVFETTEEAHKALLNCAWCGNIFCLTYISVVPVEYVGEESVELTTIEPDTYYNLQIQGTDPALYLSAGWQDDKQQVLTLGLNQSGYEKAFKFVPVAGKEGVYNLIGKDGKAIYADSYNCYWNGNPSEANLASAAYQVTVQSEVGYLLIKTSNKYIGSDGVSNWSKVWTDKGTDKAVKFVPVKIEEGWLWRSGNEAEESTADWRRVYTMSADDAKEKIAVGDYIVLTVSYVNPEGGWPQVAIMPINGWPPYTNSGVDKNSTCPLEVRFPVTGPLAQQLWENGFGVSGGDVRISKVALEKGTEVLDPNTVWFGGKQCNWGDGISLSKDIFANCKAGDKVVINYAPGEATLQLMPGGWSGPNFPIYGGLPFFTRDEAANQMIFTLQSNFDAFEYEVEGEMKTFDIFSLLKNDGLMMHGPCFVNSILYIVGEEPVATDHFYMTGNFGTEWDPANAVELVKGEDGNYAYTATGASMFKISKNQGAWNVFNGALVYPTNYSGAAITAGEWMTYEVVDAMGMDFTGYSENIIMPWKGDWTVTINPAESKMQFTTTTPAPAPVNVYYNNAETNWDEVYVYLWNGDNNNGAWPGNKMTKGEGTIWSYSFTGFEPANVIFNNGGNGGQTDYLVFEAGKTYGAPVTPVATTVTDVLNNGNTVNNTASTYSDYTGVTISSDAVYSLNAGGDKGTIQLRSKNSNSGIVTTVSGGTVKKVTITYNEATVEGRTLDVYAKNTAYAAPTDLYSAVQGTKVASLTLATADGYTYSYEFDTDYEYVGLRSNSGAMYLDNVEIEWATAGATVVAPTFTPAPGMVKSGTQVTMETQTADAVIYYTTDGTEPTAASTKYTEPVAIYDYTVFKAVAIAYGESSKVVTAEYTVMPVLEDLSPIMDFEDGTKFDVNCELTVVYANGSNVYVTDGTYYGLIFKNNLGLAAGDVIAAGWEGALSIYNGLYEIVPQTELTKSESAPKVANPVPVDAEDAEMTLAAYNMNRYFELQGVVFEEATPANKANFTGKMGEFEVTFRNNFTLESVEAGTYNVTGFVSVYNTTIQFLPVSYAVPPTVCDNIVALSALTEEQAMNVKLTLTDAKVTYYAQNNGSYFLEDATGAMQLMPTNDEAEPEAVESLAQGKAVTGYVTGMYSEGGFYCFANKVDITASEDVDVTFGTEMTLAQAKEPANANMLVTFVASDDLTITRDEDALIISQGEDMMYVMDPYYSFPEDYEFPENVEKVTGILMNMGNVFVAPRDPADIVPVEVVEEGLLWKSSNVDEESTADWRRVYTMSAEEAKEKIGVGDYLIVTVSYVNPEGGWPQVAVLPIEGWPPYTNEGVSKEAACPFDVRFPVAGPLAKQMWENGFGVSGGDVRISKIKLEKATEELDPNTVWFGGKQCNWGNGISLSKDIFANCKAGDKVVINYAPGDATLQLMPGSDWNGLNLPSYAGLPYFVKDDEAHQMIFTLQDNFDALEYEDKTWDVFTLLKEGGLTMHGPCFVNSILYVPAPEVEMTIEPNVYYNLLIQDHELYLSAGWQDNNRQVNTLSLGEPGYEQIFKFVPVADKEGVYNIIGLDGKAIYASGGWDCFWNDAATAENLASEAYQFTVEPAVGYITIKSKNGYIGSDGIWGWSKVWTDKGADKAVKFVPVNVNPEFTVYFDNSESQWETVYAYVWNDETNNNWPGVEMTKGEADVWSFTTSDFEPTNIIFNNNAGQQTADLEFKNGKTYVGEAPAPATELYLRGTISNWGTDMKFETEDNVNYTLVVNDVIPAGAEFKIANADWTVSYTYTADAILPGVEYVFVDGQGMDNNTKVAEEIKAGAKLTFNTETCVFKIDGESGINAIGVEEGVEYYNMQGIRLNAPTPGKPCIRVANGVATKVIIK